MKIPKHLMLFSTVLGTTCSSFQLLSDIFFLDELKNYTELKIEDAVVPLPKKLNDLILKVENEMKLKTEEVSLIRPYFTKYLDIIQFGYTSSKAGSILGIPQYFVFDEKTEVKLTSVVSNIELPPESSETHILKNAFLLSEAAKKFGIAHQINESRHYFYYPLNMMGSAYILSFYFRYSYIFKDPAKIKKQTLNFKSFFLLIEICLFIIIHAILTEYKEAEADFKAAELGKSYLEGGIEYYEKMIKRNKLLKKFDKKLPYSEDGDININWLKAHVPLSRRVIYLKNLLKSAEKYEKKPQIMDYISLRDILKY